MSDILERAIEHVRALPPGLQDELAMVLLQLIGEDQPVCVMSAEEESLIAPSDARRARGESASERMREILSKYDV